MDDSELLPPIRRSNGTFENPFETFQGLPAGGKVCRFLRDRLSRTFNGPSKPTQVGFVLGFDTAVTYAAVHFMSQPNLETLFYH